MKITKSQLKQVIKEAIEGDTHSPLLSAIESLAGKIEDLDVSIDYLASSITGDSAAVIGYGQKALGRFARKPKMRKDSFKEGLKQDIREVLEEIGNTSAAAGASMRAAGLAGKRDEEEEVDEVLGPDAEVGDYIEDFKDSDAPQFKGKSKEKRKEMAVAAALDAKDNK